MKLLYKRVITKKKKYSTLINILFIMQYELLLYKNYVRDLKLLEEIIGFFESPQFFSIFFG